MSDLTPQPDDQHISPIEPEMNPMLYDSIRRNLGWEPRWISFRTAHHNWWRGVEQDEPVYWLPDEVIDALKAERTTTGRRHRGPLIDRRQADAERAFRQLCQEYNRSIVGVWGEQPVDYGILDQPDLALDESMIPEELRQSWAAQGFLSEASLTESLVDGNGKFPRIRHQLIGYAGRLMFHSEFRDELTALKSQWLSLPRPVPMDIRLSMLIGQAPPQTVESVPSGTAEASAFYDELKRFLQKWQLIRMVTWDLPQPQGPLQPVPVGLLAQLQGPDILVDHHPAFYDIPSKENVREQIRSRQEQIGRDSGSSLEFPVTDTSPRRGAMSEYETAFRMWLMEVAIRRRYGTPKGLVVCLTNAYEGMFHLSLDRIKKIRQKFVRYLPSQPD